MNWESLTLSYIEWWFKKIANTKLPYKIWTILWTTTMSLIVVPICAIIDVPSLLLHIGAD